MFRTFIRQVIVYADKIEIRYNYTACPQILKNPVSIALTGLPECSGNDSVVRLEGFEPSHPVPETGALSPEL